MVQISDSLKINSFLALGSKIWGSRTCASDWLGRMRPSSQLQVPPGPSWALSAYMGVTWESPRHRRPGRYGVGVGQRWLTISYEGEKMKNYYMKSPDHGTLIATQDPSLWSGYDHITKREYDETQKAESLAFLRKALRSRMTVYTTLGTVSRSGMSRTIKVWCTKKGKPVNLSWHIAKVLGYPLTDDHFLKVSGCGMDMGFSVVYDLGKTIWPKGTRRPHGSRNGVPDRDGGYALNHEWF